MVPYCTKRRSNALQLDGNTEPEGLLNDACNRAEEGRYYAEEILLEEATCDRLSAASIHRCEEEEDAS